MQAMCTLAILFYVVGGGRSGSQVPEELASADGAALEAWKSRKLQGKVVQSKWVDATFGKGDQNATFRGHDRSALHDNPNLRCCWRHCVQLAG
jgi:hypothetical protein